MNGMSVFWSDPYLYLSAGGLLVSITLLFYFVKRWRLAFEADDDMDLAPAAPQAISGLTSLPPGVPKAPGEPPKAETAKRPALSASAAAPAASKAAAPEPSPAAKPQPAAAEAPSPRGTNPAHSIDEVLEHLSTVHQQIRDLQYLLQGLENKRAEELHEIERRLNELEQRLEPPAAEKTQGPIFPV